MSPSNENVFTDTHQTPFREFIPDLSIDRFTSMRKQDAYEYADAFKKDGNPPWIHGLYLHWRELLAEPYKGVTNDGRLQAMFAGKSPIILIYYYPRQCSGRPV